MKVSVKADVEKVQKALEGTKKGIKRGTRSFIRVIARGTVKAIKGGIRATTKRRTGELLRAYGYKVWRSGEGATVRPKGANGSRIFPKVFSLNYGRKKDRLEGRYFVQQGERYAQKPSNWQGEAERIIQKELDRYWGKQ